MVVSTVTSTTVCAGCGKLYVEEIDSRLAAFAGSSCPVGWLQMHWTDEPLAPSPELPPPPKELQFCETCKPKALAALVPFRQQNDKAYVVYAGESVTILAKDNGPAALSAAAHELQEAAMIFMRVFGALVPDDQRAQVARAIGETAKEGAAITEKALRDALRPRDKPS